MQKFSLIQDFREKGNREILNFKKLVNGYRIRIHEKKTADFRIRFFRFRNSTKQLTTLIIKLFC